MIKLENQVQGIQLLVHLKEIPGSSITCITFCHLFKPGQDFLVFFQFTETILLFYARHASSVVEWQHSTLGDTTLTKVPSSSHGLGNYEKINTF